jgi:two-component system sensor histidine kinase ArlS
MKHISIKIGLLFFAAIFLLETISMYFLHNNIIHSRVHEELSALQTRGNNHREILEASFYEETMQHIALMESRTDTQVILTNSKGTVIMSSNAVMPKMRKTIKSTPKNIPYDGLILEDDWQHKSYIASISPIKVKGKITGYVYMFQTTQKIKELISGLNHHFILAGMLSLIFIVLIIIFLTRYVTQPVIEMSKATKRISKGDFSVSLPKLANDEIGELGESIQILARDLEILKKDRNEFLASISHELRTPLTYIKGYAEIARRPETAIDDRDHYLGIIFEEAVKLSNLVIELFNLAKMDENNFSIEKESVHLLPYLRAITEKVSPALKESNMDLVLNCPDDVSKDQEKARIKIQDQGKGIPAEDLPRIFERFYRVDKSRTRALGGSGLGLSIVKQLVEAHGGVIKVKSEPNVGTTFEIFI